MKKTVGEIAAFLGGTVVGSSDTVIENIRPIEDAAKGDLTFLANKKYLKKMETTGASAILVSPGITTEGKTLIIVSDPYAALGKILALFYPVEHGYRGVSPDARIEKGARISQGATIFPQAFIAAGATIGARTVIYPNVFIGRDVSIGEDCILYPHVTVYSGCVIGHRVILHAGVVVGADGFGFASPGKENVKIPQVGIVQIDDDVEVGANTTIDRAALGKTWIQKNVKIDNLVQIAHNVVIGENSVITAQVGISGSTKLGRSVLVGGQTGIVGHITIGDNVMIAAGSGVHSNVKTGQVVGGSPQVPFKEWLHVEACRAKLPEMRASLRDLLKRVEKLEQNFFKKDSQS